MRNAIDNALADGYFDAMNLKDYFEQEGRGSMAKLAADIGVHAPDVSDWANGSRPVPIIHCAAIEKATGGLVTRRDLRPDDWQMIWPELQTKNPQSVNE